MRSNKERWLRGGVVLAWLAVLTCAAYTLGYFNRGKDWRDYTPIERIAALTPKHVSCALALDGGSETWTVRDVHLIDGFVVFFPPRRHGGAPRRLTSHLIRVGAQIVRIEIVRGSEMEKTVLGCLDRAIRSGNVDGRSLPLLVRLRSRLTKEEFSQDAGVAAH